MAALYVDLPLRTVAALQQALPAVGRTPQGDVVTVDLLRDAAINSSALSRKTAAQLLRAAPQRDGTGARGVDARVFDGALHHARDPHMPGAGRAASLEALQDSALPMRVDMDMHDWPLLRASFCDGIAAQRRRVGRAGRRLQTARP